MFEYSHKTTEKWPLQFDLEGVPRDRRVREMELARIQGEQMEAMHDPQIIDLSNPPRQHYTPQAFPKMMYDSHGRYMSAENEKQAKQLEKQGFGFKPLEEFDYSKIVAGKATKRPISDEPAPVELSE